MREWSWHVSSLYAERSCVKGKVSSCVLYFVQTRVHLTTVPRSWTLSTCQNTVSTRRSTTSRKLIDPLHYLHPTNPRSTQKNQVNSPLLRLPPELRNRVYAYAFTSATLKCDSAIVGYRTSIRYYIVRDGAVLRRICRQTRSEIRPFQLHNSSTALSIGCYGEWFQGVGCSKIVDLEMSFQPAEALHKMLRHQYTYGCSWYPKLRDTIGSGFFLDLQRVVVTFSESDLEDLRELDFIRRSLSHILKMSDPKVYAKSAESQEVYYGGWWTH